MTRGEEGKGGCLVEGKRRKVERGGKPVFLLLLRRRKRRREWPGSVVPRGAAVSPLYSYLNTVCLISRWKIVPLVEGKEEEASLIKPCLTIAVSL